MDQEITAAVRRVVHEHLGVAEADIGTTSSFTEDLGADPLQLVELTLALEDAFGVTIVDEEARKMRTLQDAVRFIEKNRPDRPSS